MIRMPERPGQREMQRWLGQLRGDEGWEPDHDLRANGSGPAQAVPRWAGPAALLPGPLPGGARQPWQQTSAQRPGGRHGADGAGGQSGDPLRHPVPLTERPVIGDELRLPHVWCQAGQCIARHADPDALGEADARARAIAAGWREDGLGRLICPGCQRGDSYFWIGQPVVQWDRGMAFAMTSLVAAAIPDDAVGAAGAETGVLPAALPVPPRTAGPAAAAARESIRHALGGRDAGDRWDAGDGPGEDHGAADGRGTADAAARGGHAGSQGHRGYQDDSAAQTTGRHRRRR